MTSAHYDVPGAGRDRPGVGVDSYRSPFSPTGQAHYVWSDRAQPLPQILKENSLPLVVKLSEEACVRSEGDNFMDFRQPLLLYREHQLSRLYARNIAHTQSTGTSKGKEVGPYVVIPHNYQGLFRPLDQPNTPLTSVSTVARLMPVSILSATACEGYVCVSPIESDTVFQKTDLPPGVYIVKDIVEDNINVLSGRKTQKTKLVRCLRCVNDVNKVVLFPLKVTGQFYVAGVDARSSRQSSVDTATRVYRWPELTKLGQQDNQTCNITAALVHGKPPVQECNFTGILAFKHVTKDQTVIGCTTTEGHPRLFELSRKQGPNFVVALNQECVDTDSPLSRCVKFAKQEFDRYMSDIKVRRDYEVDSVELRESGM